MDWSIGTTAFGTDIGSGTAPVSSSFLFENGIGYNIFSNTVTGLSPSTGAGTDWLTLSNAVTPGVGPNYWDQINGPSQTFQNGSGLIGSQSFDIIGADAAPTPEPGSVGLMGFGVMAIAVSVRRKMVRN